MPDSCAGCGKTAGEFQCPLCQAAELDGGFFCTQECFAACFVKHRDEVHKGGTVRAKRSDADKAKEREEKTKTAVNKKKRAMGADAPTSAKAADAEADAAEVEAMLDADNFSDEEEEAAYKAALDKELAKRKELPVWPVWDGDVTSASAYGGVGFGAKAGPSSALFTVDDAATGSAKWARSDVAITGDDVPAQLHAACVFAIQSAANWASRGASRRAVIVAGSAVSCHAAAWAARCRGIECVPVAGSDEQSRTRSAELILAPFTARQAQIVVVSTDALGADVDSRTGRAAEWLVAGAAGSNGSGLLITLPDVGGDPTDLQSMTAPSVFIRPAAECSPSSNVHAVRAGGVAAASPTKKKGASTAGGALLCIPPLTGAPPLVAADHGTSEARFDPEMSAALVVRGDLNAAFIIAARLYSEHKHRAEEAIVAALMCDWGAPSAVHAHHKLAAALRMLVDSSVKMSTMTKVRDDFSLAYIAARCIVRAAKHLPQLDASHHEALGSPCPFVYLDATIAYCFHKIPKSIVDELSEAWGIHRLGVTGSLGHADRMRTVALHKLRTAYQPKLGVVGATFAGVVHHCIADAAMRHAMNVKDVRAATLWDFTCAGPYGDLEQFLVTALLVHRPEDMTSKSGYTREGVKTTKTQRNKKVVTDISFVNDATIVQQHPTVGCPKMKRLQWPIKGARKRRRDLMWRAAFEELQSALPASKNVPMYLGDIGNLIGKWTAYNSKYGGYLPTTLQQFIEAYPEEFNIVGNIVTRSKDSKTQQVKIRFDNDNNDHDSDSDDGGRKKKKRSREETKRISLQDIKTRRGLVAAEKKLLDTKSMTKRAAKKKMKGLRNKARYNKNHKSIAKEARVPGYVKPKEKGIKGRGRKANKRTTKRQ